MTQSNIQIVDGASIQRLVRFETSPNDTSLAARNVIDVDGNAVSALGGVSLPVKIAASSLGTDYSANKSTAVIPNVGANFGSTGPYANYVLIATVPAGARVGVDIENISGAQIVVVRDDGTASSGGAPNNASIFVLGGGTAAGAQGGSWQSSTFKGRLQIYALSSAAMVTVMVD